MSDISFIKNNQIDKLDFGSGLVLKVFFDEENGARNFSLGTVTIEPNCETSMHTRSDLHDKWRRGGSNRGRRTVYPIVRRFYFNSSRDFS